MSSVVYNHVMTTIIQDVCLEYLRKYPTLPTRQIARCIYEQEKPIFRDVEHARSMLRYYRGQQGDAMRKQSAKYIPREYVQKTEERSYEPYVADKFPIAIGCDAHMPYHSENAINAFLDHTKRIKAETIILNGDWLDCYQLSVFARDPRRRDFVGEIEMMRSFLQGLRKEFFDCTIIYKEGNHEERLVKYLQQNAPQLFGLAEISLPFLLHLDDLGIDWVGDKRIIMAEKLHILHGHEYRRSFTNPVNPARGLYLKTKKSSLCGHYHQSSEHTDKTIDGTIQTCWSLGCLCELSPQYEPLNNWSNGFADIAIDDDRWIVHNHRMYKGKVL